jgi:hypothetical protein
MKHSLLAKTLLVAGVAAFTSSSAWAAMVTWEFNPAGLNANVGSSARTYTVSGFSITARGYDNVANGANGLDIARELHYKNEPPVDGATERGLGLYGTVSNELNLNPDGTPAQYIQLDLRSILALGFRNGQVSVGSMQNGEGFRLFASDIQGALGTLLPGTWNGLAFDNKFVAVPNFGSFQFLTIAAVSGRVLPVAFQAEPIPEMSTLLPILALFGVVFVTGMKRRAWSAR